MFHSDQAPRPADRQVRDLLPPATNFNDDEVQLAITAARHVALAIERQRAEQELKRLNAELESRVRSRTSELEQANRELASFSYSVSHDLRAPLRALNGFAHVLVEDYADKLDRSGRQHLERILSASVRIDQLTVDLRLADINRSVPHNEEVDISALSEQILGRLAESAPERMLHSLIQPRLQVLADRGLLTVMMENLLGNAWKYSAGKAGHRDPAELRDSREAVDLLHFGQRRRIRHALRRQAVQKPFERLHGAEFQGSGIGLAIVERIVRRFNGRIWADSKAWRGALLLHAMGRAGIDGPERRPLTRRRRPLSATP